MFQGDKKSFESRSPGRRQVAYMPEPIAKRLKEYIRSHDLGPEG
jgi:hypothetical protein